MMYTTISQRSQSSGPKWAMAAVAVSVLIPLAVFRLAGQEASKCSGSKCGRAPQGWFITGSKPANYESGVDHQANFQGAPSAFLKSKADGAEGFGTLMQNFRAGQYAGKRVRMSAWVKSQDVAGWAGLWMRVDKDSTPVSFDNMEDRPVKNTTDWQQYDVVLDVAPDADSIAMGILLNKSGTVWINGVKVETVGNNVPVTNQMKRPMPDGPTNLNFEN